MVLSAIAFLLGILACLQLQELPPIYWAGALFLLIPAAYWIRPLRLPSLILIGFLWAVFQGHWILSSELSPELEKRELTAVGYIASLPQDHGEAVRFEFDIDTLLLDGQAVAAPSRVRLSWFDGHPSVHAGERWQLNLSLKRPHGLSNPGGFDYESWLFQHRLRATGYVTKGDNHLLESGSLLYVVDRVRQAIRDRMLAAMENKPFAGVLVALVMGDQSGVAPEQWTVFLKTGTNHLVAISGMHVTWMAGMAFFVVRRVWGRFPRAVMWLPSPKAAAWAGFIAASVYTALAGFAIPTQRAWVMTSVLMLAVMLGRRALSSRTLAVALLAVLIYDPFSALSPGFWLSFAAVAAIFFAMQQRVDMNGMWWKWGRVQWVVTIGLVPIMLVLFQRLSLIAPIANLFAVPWVSFITVPLALIGGVLVWLVPPLGSAVLWLAHATFEWHWYPLTWLAELSWSVWSQHAPLLWTIWPALIGVVLLLSPRGLPARSMGAIMMLPMLLNRPPQPVDGEALITLLDVGQGLSVVVRTSNHTLLFDAGPKVGENFDSGESVVIPFMRAVGRTRIDRFIVSHGDADHIGGAPSVLALMPVGDVLSSVPEKIPKAAALMCTEEHNWKWDGVTLQIFRPGADMVAATENDASCVLRIEAGGYVAILPADIEKRAESVLVARHRLALDADLLVAPHHGSSTSSTTEFINAVSPVAVLFPIGYLNRYRFPKSEVVARYRENGVRMYDTAHSGALTARLSRAGISDIEAERQRIKRFWHSP